MDQSADFSDEPWDSVRQLGEVPRRVLGALLEKAFTTPDAYPLTLKALTTACNQKNNREPVVDFTEDEVAEAVEELQSLGLVAEVHTDGGRALRYRHLVRKRFPWTEPQLAVMTELWLRGRQQLGELRTRASRMVAIETLEDLRAALQPLLAEGYVRAGGPLERRGIEVDHAFYGPGEAVPRFSSTPDEPPMGRPSTGDPHIAAARLAATPAAPAELAALRDRCTQLEARVAELEERLGRLQQQLESLLG